MAPSSIKALSLWQPWATLIALRFKEIETRSWSTPYRGKLAIHAAKRKYNPNEVTPNFRSLLRQLNIDPAALPYGCIVAIVDLVDIHATHVLVPTLSDREFAFGDYGPGRFGWVLKNIRALDKPIPASGKQALWDWTPPDDFSFSQGVS